MSGVGGTLTQGWHPIIENMNEIIMLLARRSELYALFSFTLPFTSSDALGGPFQWMKQASIIKWYQMSPFYVVDSSSQKLLNTYVNLLCRGWKSNTVASVILFLLGMSFQVEITLFRPFLFLNLFWLPGSKKDPSQGNQGRQGKQNLRAKGITVVPRRKKMDISLGNKSMRIPKKMLDTVLQ